MEKEFMKKIITVLCFLNFSACISASEKKVNQEFQAPSYTEQLRNYIQNGSPTSYFTCSLQERISIENSFFAHLKKDLSIDATKFETLIITAAEYRRQVAEKKLLIFRFKGRKTAIKVENREYFPTSIERNWKQPAQPLMKLYRSLYKPGSSINPDQLEKELGWANN